MVFLVQGGLFKTHSGMAAFPSLNPLMVGGPTSLPPANTNGHGGEGQDEQGKWEDQSRSGSSSEESEDEGAVPPDLSGLSAATLAALEWHLAGGGYSSQEEEEEYEKEASAVAMAATSMGMAAVDNVTMVATRAAAQLRRSGNVDVIAATMARLKASSARAEAAHQGAIYDGLDAAQKTLLVARSGDLIGTTREIGGVAHIARAVHDLREDGIVRLDGCLTAALCDAVREDINAQMAKALKEGLKCGDRSREDGYGGVLARTCRYDAYQRPTGSFQRALLYMLGGDCDYQGGDGGSASSEANSTKSDTNHISGSHNHHQVRKLFEALYAGAVEDAPFTELSVLLSDPGAPRQQVHPDNQYQPVCPCYTVFIALQDIDEDMGPTVFLPRSNTAQCHADFNEGSNAFQQDKKTVTVSEASGGPASSVSKEVSVDWFLKSREWSTSLLKKGDVQILDSMTLHAATANVSAKRRSLLYFTLRNPMCVDFAKPGTPHITEGSLFRDVEICLADYSLYP